MPATGVRLRALMRTSAAVRAGVALAQALLIYLLGNAALTHAWPATVPMLMQPILVCAEFVPILAALGIGRLRPPALGLWLGIATAAIAVLAVHSITRMLPAPAVRLPPRPSVFALGPLLGAALFVAQSLLLAAAADRRWRPSYPRLFETSWNLGVQLVLTALFLGLFWAILGLGALLFGVVGLHGFGRLLTERAVSLPLTTLAIAFAIHVTSLRGRLVDGARTLVLTLFGFLLPVLAAIAGAFLVSLCFVSAQPLWRTHHALLLLSMAVLLLLLLLNAAYRDGLAEAAASAAVRVTGRVGAILLLPLTGLAIVALHARVAEDGWSPERVLAAAWLLVCGLYALGYLVAALRPRRWLAGIETVNVAMAAVVVLVLLALLTPLADPARIAAGSQVARLRAGRVAADRFDYAFLATGSAGYGRAALLRLQRDPPAQDAELVRRRATAALAARPGVAMRPQESAADIIRNVTVHPAGRALPPTLLPRLAQWHPWDPRVPNCLRMRDRRCDAVFIDLRHDGTEQLAFIEPDLPNIQVMAMGPDGVWSGIGSLTIPIHCESLRNSLIAGRMTTAPSPWADLLVDGHHIAFTQREDLATCPK